MLLYVTAGHLTSSAQKNHSESEKSLNVHVKRSLKNVCISASGTALRIFLNCQSTLREECTFLSYLLSL